MLQEPHAKIRHKLFLPRAKNSQKGISESFIAKTFARVHTKSLRRDRRQRRGMEKGDAKGKLTESHVKIVRIPAVAPGILRIAVSTVTAHRNVLRFGFDSLHRNL